MNSVYISSIDIFIIAIFLLANILIALSKYKKINNIRDYALSDNITSGALMATLFATYIGAGSTVGNIEKVYEKGLIFAVAMMFGPLIWITTAKVFANNIEYFKEKGCMSISDVMEVLYGKTARWITNILYTMLAVGVLTMQVTAIGYLLHFFLGVSREVGAFIGFSVLTFYSALGGIRAVIVTDILQSFVLFVGIPLACLTAYYNIGGYEALISKLPPTHTSFEINRDNIILLASLIFYFMIPISSGSYIQRYLMARSSNQLNSVMTRNAFISIPFMLTLCFVGYIVKATNPDLNPNQAFYYIIGNDLPPIVTGIIISGILAAIMSTADSWLNTASILIAHDIIKKASPVEISEKAELNIARFAVIFLSGLAAILSLKYGKSILGIDWFVSNFWEPLVLVPIAFGFLKFRTNFYSYITCILFGIFGSVSGAKITGEYATISLLMGVLSGVFGMIIAHRFQGLHKLEKQQINSKVVPQKKNFFQFSISGLSLSLNKYLDTHGKYYTYLGIFGLTYYLVASLAFDFDYSANEIRLLSLRGFALFISFMLCMNEVYLPKNLRSKVMPYFWFFSLSYLLPFMGLYTFFISGFDTYWFICLLLSLLLMIILGGWSAFAYGSVIGFIAAYFNFASTDYLVEVGLNDEGPVLVFIMMVSIVFLIFFIKKKEEIFEEKIESKLIYGSSIAHEIRNTLFSAELFAKTVSDIVNQGEKISKEDIEFLKGILPSFKKALNEGFQIVDRNLNAVRSDIKNAEDNGVYQSSETVREALEAMKLGEDQRARIILNLENEFEYHGSRHFIKHVIMNLVSNGLKYAGKEARITISSKSEDMSLIVSDNGRGIELEQLEYIFDPFSEKRKVTGTGIGLAFVKRVMDEMGGSVECQSELGKYTKFILRFPN